MTSQATRRQHVVTYVAAGRCVDAATAHAERIGVPVNVAVTCPAGNLVAFARMDGAPLMSGTIAIDKAWSVAAFNGVPTHDWFGMIEKEPALREGIVHRDRLVIFGGGVGLLDDGELVGAIGISGGTADQDRAVAEAGAAALQGAGAQSAPTTSGDQR